MHADTLENLITNGVGVLGELAKDRLVRSKEQEMMETKMQHEKEIARLRQRALRDMDGGGGQMAAAGAATQTTPERVTEPQQVEQPEAEPVEAADGLEAAEEMGKKYETVLEDAKKELNCSFCRAVLEDLEERPLREQVQGVRELRKLKTAMKEDASRERFDELVDSFDVLTEPEKYV